MGGVRGILKTLTSLDLVKADQNDTFLSFGVEITFESLLILEMAA